MSTEPTGPGATASAPVPVDPVSLQILSTEHWSLLASRQLAWNESFSRATMLLATLSGATVALALAAQASDFGRTFVLFALAVLPVVLYVGIMTFLRLAVCNYHDYLCVVGMNRIRAAYLEMAPELRRTLVMSPHDDVHGVAVTMGLAVSRNNTAHLLSATPSVVAVLTSAVAGVIGALLGVLTGIPNGAAVTCGVAGFVACFLPLIWYGRRRALRDVLTHDPQYPTPCAET